MNYTPQAGDIISRGDQPAVHVRKVTAATVVIESTEGEKPTPRALFDSMFEKTAPTGVIVTRDGKEILNTAPPSLVPATGGSSGSGNYHSRLAPSAAKRWTTCTASVGYIEANYDRILPVKVGKVTSLTPYLKSIPPEEVKDYEWRAMKIAADIEAGLRSVESLTPQDRKDIEYTEGSVSSREGTRAHDFAEAILSGRKKLEDIPKEFQESLRVYVEHCLSLVPDGETPIIEQSVPLFYSENPNDTGTTDFAVITPEGIHIRDYKNGAGVEEVAVRNKQLSIYGLSLIEMHHPLYGFEDCTPVTLGIVQPNHHAGDPVKIWETTVGELRAFCKDIHDAAVHVRKGEDLSFNPTEDGCMWCDARAFCGARHAAITQDAATAFALEVMPDLTKEELKAPVGERIEHYLLGHTLSTDQLVAIFKNKDRIRKFLGDVEDYVQSLAATAPIPGLKWVEGRQGNRDWRNSEEAEVFLRGQGLKQDDRYTYKLKSPAQIETLLKDKLKNTRTKNRFEELVTRSDGKPVLVPEEDKRPGLPSPGDVMPDVSEEDL